MIPEIWDIIIFPDASSVDINGMVGLDNSGLRYDVDHRYQRLFGFAAPTSAFFRRLRPLPTEYPNRPDVP
jgi:type IV secretory pathway VirB10-like protein